MSRIYLSVPHMGELEQGFVADAFRSNWLSSVGPHIDAFEEEFAARIGRPAVAVASGTAAIHMGFRLLGVGRGDEVFCPSLTFIATINPAVYQGATPVFLDSERRSWNLDPNVLEHALRERAKVGKLPKAVVVVHLYGQTADMGPILELCARYGVPILEDAAEALGATHQGRQPGTFSPIAAFSFNGNKIITTTGGGMMVAEDEAMVRKARFWAQQARDPGVAYEHTEIGYNYRMSNVLAGIGRGQLRVLDQRVAARRAVAARYVEAFAPLGPGLEVMPEAPWGTHTRWLSCFLIEEGALGCSRDELIEALAKQDIEARPVWKPLHMQKVFDGAPSYGGAVAEDLFRRGICLPSSSSLTIEDQDRVISVIRATARRRRADSSSPSERRHA